MKSIPSISVGSAHRAGWSVLAFALKFATLLVAAGYAFQQTIGTLIRAGNNPASIVSASIVIAACLLAVIEGLARREEPDIHDRTIDYILGVTAIAAACIILWITPITFSLFFWVWRLDWLALPLFVGGAVAVLFGIRTVWRQRLPILLVAAAWPLPLIALKDAGWIGAIDSTAAAAAADIGHSLEQLGVISSVANTSPWSTYVGLDVMAACVVAIALALTARARLAIKAAWVVLAIGSAWLLGVAVLVGSSLATLPAWSMGLVPVVVTIAVAWTARRQGDGRLPKTAFELQNRLAPGALATALIAVLGGGFLLSLADHQLVRYRAAADDFGSSKLVMPGDLPGQLVGWSTVTKQSHHWGAVYLDKSATWTRYTYQPVVIDGAQPVGEGSFTIDVISTTDMNSLSTYDVAANYQLQGHQLLSSSHVDLGSGIIGQAVRYALGANQGNWIGVYWEWPVSTSNGSRYERLVFSALDSTQPGLLTDQVSDPALTVGLAIYNSLAGPNETASSRAARVLAFLVEAARKTVMWAEPSATLP